MRVTVWCCAGCGLPLDWVPPLREPLYCCEACRAGQCTCDERALVLGVAHGNGRGERPRAADARTATDPTDAARVT